MRRIAFGPDSEFIRYLGHYVAIFTMPNYIGLDHLEMIFQHEGTPVSVCIAKEKENEARTYLGFNSGEPIQYDHRDISAQKQLVADRATNLGGMISKIKQLMHDSNNFYFDSVNQTIMDTWFKGRVVLVGDAGYSVSLSLGQSTSVTMVGAYVLTSELAEHWRDLPKAFAKYESELKDYVVYNQQLAFDASTAPQQSFGETTEEGTTIDADSLPDFGQSVIPLTLKNYDNY